MIPVENAALPCPCFACRRTKPCGVYQLRLAVAMVQLRLCAACAGGRMTEALAMGVRA